MRTHQAVFVAFAVLSCAFAQAQNETDDYGEEIPAKSFVEITPFVGYRLGGDFDLQPGDPNGSEMNVDAESGTSLALAVNFRIDELSQYEIFYSRQNTNLDPGSPIGAADLKVEYLHIGGTLIVDEMRRIQPYILGTIGATRLQVDAPATREKTGFSVSLGAGLRVPVSERFSLRLETRGFLTFLDTDSAVFCTSGSFGGLCALQANGSSFFQYDFMAGAAYAF